MTVLLPQACIALPFSIDETSDSLTSIILPTTPLLFSPHHDYTFSQVLDLQKPRPSIFAINLTTVPIQITKGTDLGYLQVASNSREPAPARCWIESFSTSYNVTVQEQRDGKQHTSDFGSTIFGDDDAFTKINSVLDSSGTVKMMMSW
jgi:hypothetical protein